MEIIKFISFEPLAHSRRRRCIDGLVYIHFHFFFVLAIFSDTTKGCLQPARRRPFANINVSFHSLRARRRPHAKTLYRIIHSLYE